MLICHCFAVNDARVRELARTRRAAGGKPLRYGDVVRSCGAGRGCGGCRNALQQILAQEHAPEPPASDVLPAAAAAVV